MDKPQFTKGDDVRIIIPHLYEEDMTPEMKILMERISIFHWKTGKVNHAGNSDCIIDLDKPFNRFLKCLIPFEYLMPFDRYTMVVTISFAADPSVGIRSYYHTMTIDRFTNEDDSKEVREEIREKIRELYNFLDQEFQCQVHFDDEEYF